MIYEAYGREIMPLYQSVKFQGTNISKESPKSI